MELEKFRMPEVTLNDTECLKHLSQCREQLQIRRTFSVRDRCWLDSWMVPEVWWQSWVIWWFGCPSRVSGTTGAVQSVRDIHTRLMNRPVSSQSTSHTPRAPWTSQVCLEEATDSCFQSPTTAVGHFTDKSTPKSTYFHTEKKPAQRVLSWWWMYTQRNSNCDPQAMMSSPLLFLNGTCLLTMHFKCDYRQGSTASISRRHLPLAASNVR